MLDLPAMLAATDASTEVPTALAGSTGSALCAQAPRLRRLVHRLLGWPASGSDVDDVVQEVLLAAWRHRDSFRGEATLSTWLVRIAVRKAQNHARAAAVRRRLFAWCTHAEAVARPEADANHERLAATQLAMHRLNHRDREVLVLRYLEQREIPQIADLLGCSRTAVDARLSRARQRLRAELQLEPGA